MAEPRCEECGTKMVEKCHRVVTVGKSQYCDIRETFAIYQCPNCKNITVRNY